MGDMRNADAIKLRLDKVKQTTSYTDALVMLADIQYEIGVEACRERQEMHSEIDSLKVLILGNGNPEKSLVNRLSVLERSVDKSSEQIEKIHSALIGSIEGDKGLLDRMGIIESMKEDFDKVKWLVIGVMVAQIVVAIIKIL